MDDFFKTKVGFTVGLLATIFAIKPLIDQYGDLGFLFFGMDLTIKAAYLLLISVLGLAVYFISLQFASSKHSEWLDRLSNACYSFALIIPPIFSLFWGVTILLAQVSKLFEQLSPEVLSGVAAFLTGYVGKNVYLFIAKSIKQKFLDAENKTTKSEILESLNRASELNKSGMYDLAVFEASKVVESTLRQLLNDLEPKSKMANMYQLQELASKYSILESDDIELLDEVRRNRNVTVHDVKIISAETSERVLNLCSELLVKLSTFEAQTA
ncbi:hypothetical protein [Vibrio tasmaniensis]|uniref:hypothetical protein n=1 Tax=Vibrio tasmaniensis TaxID=212663 RepID=UPI000319F3CB|nr:hypothetical protein [Vibrio tasmaniensis]OEF86586.1 hypothetical protein A162_08990 [Vibrio tasmaniensis 1F-155]